MLLKIDLTTTQVRRLVKYGEMDIITLRGSDTIISKKHNLISTAYKGPLSLEEDDNITFLPLNKWMGYLNEYASHLKSDSNSHIYSLAQELNQIQKYLNE